MTVAPGDILSDRYRIVEQLGEGGMGAVFRAEHVHMKKMVAVKVLLGDLARQEEVVKRFEREAIAAGSIEHPNVVTATDFGRLEDGSFFLVMEYVDGRSLRSELAKGPVPPGRALRIASGILGAIEAAHAKGIIHRDLKPENVMLAPRDGDPDFVKVLDFGIAKIDTLVEVPGGDRPGLTRTGTIMGTPEYMSPEQALGQTVDHRCDLYSLGVILYELLTGKPPFHGDAIVVMRQQVLEPPSPLPESALAEMPSLGPLLDRLLQKEPQGRFADAKELRAALASIEGGPASSPRLPAAGRVSIEVAPVSAASPAPDASAPTLLPHEASPAPARSKKGMLVAGGALLGVVAVVAAIGAGSSTTGAKASPQSRSRVARPAAKGSASASSSAASSAPAASAAPSALASAGEGTDATDDDDEAADDESPAASASATATSTAPRPKPGTASSPKRSSKPARKTGPGGIYIPPPSKWFD